MTEQQFALWEHESADPGDLRPIHYLGSKLRLLDIIEEVIDDIDPIRGRALDLFSGSGVVARRLARSRDVLAVDIQEYARVLAATLLSENRLSRVHSEAILDEARAFADGLLRGPLSDLVAAERDAIAAALTGDPARLATLIETGSILTAELEPDVSSELGALLAAAAAGVPPGPETVLTRYYGGIYFSYAHAAMLDGLAAASRGLGGDDRDGALSAVLSTASDLVSSVGNHFAQPVRPRTTDSGLKRAALASVARRRQLDLGETYRVWSDRYRTLERSAFVGRAVRGDYRALLSAPPQSVSVVYADPPYTRDHYSRFYHVLETITLGDEPEVSPGQDRGHVTTESGALQG